MHSRTSDLGSRSGCKVVHLYDLEWFQKLLLLDVCLSSVRQMEGGKLYCRQTCTVFSWISAHLRVSAHPLFVDPMVYILMRYTYKWLVCVSALPRYLGRQLQAPMDVYSREYGTKYIVSRICSRTVASEPIMWWPSSTLVLWPSSANSLHAPCVPMPGYTYICKRYLKPASVDPQGQHSSTYVFLCLLFVCLSVCLN